MARNTVSFILTAEDGKAIQAAQKLLEKIRETGQEQEKTTKKGKDGWDEMGQKILGIVGPLGTVTGAAKALMDVFDHMKEKIDAIKQAEEKAAEASKSYGEAFGKVTLNMPGAQPDELRRIDEQLRGLASTRALGEGGLVKLADAYAQIQSAIPLAPESAKMGAIGETAKILQMVPGENAEGIGLAVAKIMEGSGFTVGPTSAMNLLRQQQTLGLVKDIGPVGQSIPPLAAAARMGQVPLQDMQAMQALMTQISGDTGGQEATTALTQMTANLMTRPGDIEKALGGMVQIRGNVWERFEAIRDQYQKGLITENQLGDLFPTISRGGTGKIAIMELLGKGYGDFQQYRGMMNAPSVLQGDMTSQDLESMVAALPTEQFQQARRLLQSRREAGRAADASAAEAVLYREEFEGRMGRERRTERYKKSAGQAYDLAAIELGASPDVAAAYGRIIGTFNDRPGIPGVGGGRMPFDVMDAGKDTMLQVLREIRDALKPGNRGRIPRRNLQTGVDR
jgi:hypothetical protein